MSPIVQAIAIVYLIFAIPLAYVAWSLCRAAAKADRRGELEVLQVREYLMEATQ